jgi:hypothetical protein
MNRPGNRAWLIWPAVALAAGAGGQCVGQCADGDPATVEVVLDLDPHQPGDQSSLTVMAGTTLVSGVGVYVRDPAQTSCIYGIGYLGGIDRGIALGHMPGNLNQGSVTALLPQAGTPINPGNFALAYGPPGLDPGFAGPEVQYVEGGAAEPAPIPAEPDAPLFSVDVILAGAAAGDVFDLYLLDFVVVWSGGVAGAFSTAGHLSLDSGGDVTPDGTMTIYGVDPDAPLAAPPAAFSVDYIDGPPDGGPATIRVVPLGDVDGDGEVGIEDLLIVLGTWGPCPPPCPPSCAADIDGDCAVGITDFLLVLGNWG